MPRPNDDHSSLWHLRQPRPGSGFDHFFPKKKKNRSDSSDKRDDKKNQQGHDDKKNKNSNWNNNNTELLGLLLVMTGAVIWRYVRSKQQEEEEQYYPENHGMSSSSSSPSNNINNTGLRHSTTTAIQHSNREISWHDFLQLLQQQDVVKIVISEQDTNRPMARIYLKPNAMGLTTSSSTIGRSGGHSAGSGAWTSYEEQRHKRLRQQHQHGHNNVSSDDGHDDEEHHHHQDGSALEVGFTTATTMSSSGAMMDGGGIPATMLSSHQQSSSNNKHQMLFAYRMQIGSIDAFEHKLEEAQRALGRDPAKDVPVQYTANDTVGKEFLGAVPGLVLAAVVYGMLRMGAGGVGGGAGGRGGMGGIFQFGKSTAKKIAKEDVKVNFKDVAGCEEAKREIMEFVDFLKDSERFTKLGAKIPKGALLCGPPGTGKTLLAKAVAGEAGVPFYSISGSDFIEMFVGVGPSRVRDLFQEARANAPCIVFIDEIDAVGRQRGRGGVGGNDERENTLNQLLVEMDGFAPSTGVVVLAGTNRVDILDQALTRPGRFDRQITVDKPDLNGRKEIFKVHLKGIKLEDDVDDIAGRLAGLTPGFAGADIANICNEAAIVAARRKGETVTLDDFDKATDRIIGGSESNKIMSFEERRIVAHHEAGHAVAGWFLEHADPLLKATIIPRASGALGFAQYLPKEVFLRTQEQIMDIVCMALAGRASEEIFFGRVTTGASDDLQRVTEIVYSTIQLYGMNSRLGQLSFPKDPNAFIEDRPYSEKTAKAMDEEARMIVDDAYQRTLKLLREHKNDVETIAKMLLEKETITHEDVVNSIGPRPFAGDPAYEEFLARRTQNHMEHEKNDKDEKSDDTEDISLNPGLAYFKF